MLPRAGEDMSALYLPKAGEVQPGGMEDGRWKSIMDEDPLPPSQNQQPGYWDSLMESEDPVDRARAAMDEWGRRTFGEDGEGVARVLTELPKADVTFKEHAQDSARFVYRKMVDSGEAVERVAKAVGDKYLYAYYNFARAASNTVGETLKAGGAQTDIGGMRVGPSLADLWEPIREKGADYYKAFEDYLFHQHNIDRMSRDNTTAIMRAYDVLQAFDDAYPEIARKPPKDLTAEAAMGDERAQERLRLLNDLERAQAVQNKPVFGYPVTAEDSAAIVRALEQQHPEFVELAKGIYQYNHNLMQYRVDSGLITQEQMDHIEAVYPHYVPTYRLTEGEQVRQERRGKQVSTTVARAEGGNADLKPLHVSMAEQTRKVMLEAAKNRFGQRLMDAADAGKGRVEGLIQKVQETERWTSEDNFDLLEDPTPKMDRTFTVRRDGRAWDIVMNKDLFEAVQALEGKPLHRFWQKVRVGNDVYKALITGYNPMFSAKNFARDLQEAGLYSRDPIAWAQNYPQAVKEIATGGEWWKRYQALGGTYSSIFDYQDGYKVDKKDHSKLRRETLDRVEFVNQAIEQAPRLAEFMAQVKKNGDSMDALMDAMLASADVTTNFGRSGTWGKNMNQTFVPFLNPSLQGLDKMVRTFLGKKSAKEWLNLVARCTALGFLPLVVNELLNRDEPGWEDIRQSDKDAYWLFHIGDGKYLRIPKGRDMSVVQMVGSRVADAVRGKPVDLWGTLGTAANQIAPPNPLENNIWSPFMGAAIFDSKSPGKTWYDGDIESQRLQGYAPGERYDERTDALSKWLGGVTGVSPKKINYLLNQYTGVVGDFVLPLMTPAGDKNPLAPFKNTFVLDSVSSNKISGEFYDQGDQITYARNGGDGAMAVVGRFWNKQSKAVSDVYAAVRDLENSRELPNADKLEQIREQKAVLNGIQQNALEVLPAYEAAVRKYYTGDSDEELDVTYRLANREVFGAEYALEVYNKDTYEKAVKAARRGVDYDTFFDVYFALKEAKGDSTKGAAERQRAALFSMKGVSQEQKEVLDDLLVSDITIIPKDVKADYSSEAALAISALSESTREKAEEARAAGIADDVFVAAYEAQKGVEGDGSRLSKSREMKAAIDAATPELTYFERLTLYELFGVSESVWGAAPTASVMEIRRRRGPVMLPRA